MTATFTPDTCSAMHRLPSDEVYHFYLGDAVDLLLLEETGGRVITLGPDILGGQVVIHGPSSSRPPGSWARTPRSRSSART